ncbi:MAG: ATP-binding protein [Pyrinomonadaceae bacterium]
MMAGNQMAATSDDISSLREEIDDLRSRLAEAEGTLEAIRSGEVDALVIGDRIYSLESAVTESNRFRGDILDQINDIVIAVDNEDRLIYINPAAEAKYNARASEMLGSKVSSLFQTKWPHGSDPSDTVASIEADGFWHGENVHISRDGKKFYAESMITKVKNLDGANAGLLSVIRDVSERKRAEEELRKANERLESRVIERTRELTETNESLRNEMAARAEVERQRTSLLQRIVTSQEDERQRIARDIHDQLGQRVTALRLQIASFKDANYDLQKFDGHIELLMRNAMRLDSEVSFLAWELRPAALDDLGLPDAAKAYLDEWSHNYKIKSDFGLQGFGRTRMPAEAETHFYRILQEALNNVARHSDATLVNVLLTRGRKEVSLIVEDNGKGFDVSKVSMNHESRKGMGLLSMQERATLIGADFQLESKPNSGTTVFLRLPL